MAEKTAELAAYEEGYREAEYRQQREIDYLRGQVTGLRNMNEALIKELSRVSSYLTIQPITISGDDLEAQLKTATQVKEKDDVD